MLLLCYTSAALTSAGARPPPTLPYECQPTKGCNVCKACCKDYIPDGKICDNCVYQECGCNSESENLKLEQCLFWQEFYDNHNGTGWLYCAEHRNNPCACAAYNYGVKCNKEGTDITNIYLVGNQLRGTIPKNLSTLTALTYLALQINQLTGTIPSTLGSLSKLTTLALDCNNLTGTVPELPWPQYTENCYIGGPNGSFECSQFIGSAPNQFKCPLPPNAEALCSASCQ